MRALKIVPAAAAALCLCAAALFAGIATPTADIVVTNLRVGETYNLTQIASMPFKVMSVGLEYRIKISLIKPATDQVTPGFEPVPDITWITLSRNDFVLLPGETGSADIVISIPNDESLLGRKFEAKIHAVTVPKFESEGTFGIGLGVMGSLKFTVAPRVPTEEEKEKMRKARFKMINLSLMPNDLPVDNVPVGKKVNVEQQTGKFLRLVNAGDEPVKIRLKCIPVSETGIVVPEGWEAQPDTGFLTFARDAITVKPLEIKKVNIFTRFPADEKYRGKKYLFIVDATVEGELVSNSYRSKVYISTK